MALRKGTRGIDTLVGTATSDLIVAYHGNDVLRALAGSDLIYAGAGNDSVDGGVGDDTINGQSGADTLIGGDGDDQIDATEFGFGGSTPQPNAVDRIYGGAGDDYVTLDIVDVAFGGSGQDSFTLEVTSGPATVWAVDLSNIGTATLGRIAAAGTFLGDLRLAQFEDGGINLLKALGGSKLIGSGGDDDLSMEKSNTAPVTAILTIEGRGGDDYISGSYGKDLLVGGAGHDSLYSGYGGDDTLLGGNGDDYLSGAGGNDLLVGGAGDDQLQGGSFGDDTLQGGAGNDKLSGENGANALSGGSGVDQFVFGINLSPGAGVSRIYDFSHADDLLVFNVSFSGLNFGTEANLLRTGVTLSNGNTASGISQFLYSTSTGALAVDVNGSDLGGVTTLLFLQGSPTLTASDILIS
jgi:Ca2+-binding RTX toxin-like protein